MCDTPTVNGAAFRPATCPVQRSFVKLRQVHSGKGSRLSNVHSQAAVPGVRGPRHGALAKVSHRERASYADVLGSVALLRRRVDGCGSVYRHSESA